MTRPFVAVFSGTHVPTRNTVAVPIHGRAAGDDASLRSLGWSLSSPVQYVDGPRLI